MFLCAEDGALAVRVIREESCVEGLPDLAAVLDEGRQANAQLIEEAFYGGKGAEKLPAKEPEKNPITEQAAAAGVDPAELVKILSNPAMVNLLKSLSQTMGAT